MGVLISFTVARGQVATAEQIAEEGVTGLYLLERMARDQGGYMIEQQGCPLVIGFINGDTWTGYYNAELELTVRYRGYSYVGSRRIMDFIRYCCPHPPSSEAAR
jgi:hypothetical protein